MSTSTRRVRSIESLENRTLMAADLGVDLALAVEASATGPDYVVADSFSFSVEREMKESGEKGGTADINIGVGELQECTISKSMDAAALDAAMAETEPMCYLQYKLDRCFVKSWSTSGDADDRPTEEVAFYYNKIAFAYTPTADGGSAGTAEIDFVEVAGGADAADGAVPTEQLSLNYSRIPFSY